MWWSTKSSLQFWEAEMWLEWPAGITWAKPQTRREVKKKKAKCGSKKVVFVSQPWLLPPSECSLVVPTPLPQLLAVTPPTHVFPDQQRLLPESCLSSKLSFQRSRRGQRVCEPGEWGRNTEAWPGPGLARLNYSCISEQVLSTFSCSERRINWESGWAWQGQGQARPTGSSKARLPLKLWGVIFITWHHMHGSHVNIIEAMQSSCTGRKHLPPERLRMASLMLLTAAVWYSKPTAFHIIRSKMKLNP